MDLRLGVTDTGNALRMVLLPAAVTMILVLVSAGPIGAESPPNIGWAEFEIDEISDHQQKPQIAVSADGSVHMVYWQDNSPWILTYACRTSEGDVTIEAIATAESSLVILETAIAADSAGKVHIVYTVGEYLQYITNHAGAWTTVNLTDTMDIWGVGDIAVDSAGNPHIIACSGGWLGDVSHVTDASGDWAVETMPGLEPYTIGSYAVTVDQDDRVHICVCGDGYAGSCGLWYATTTDEGDWNVSSVDTVTSFNIYWPRPSIVVGSSGEVYLAATVNYVPGAYIPSSEVFLYCKGVSDPGGSWHEELITGSGYLPGRAVSCSSWGSIRIMVNEYFGVQHLASYDPDGDTWGWEPSPPEPVSCAAVDSDDIWHVLYVTSYHAREIMYSCNGFNVPEPLTDVDAEVDGTSVVISWSPPADSGGLEIECYRISISGIDEPIEVASNTTSHTFTDLEEERPYSYDVVAVNQLGESQSLGPYSFTTGTSPGDGGVSLLLYGIAGTLLVVAAVVVVLLVVLRKRTGRSND